MIYTTALQALVVLAALAAVLGACLYLFFSSRTDLRRAERRLEERLARMERKFEESELRFNILETQTGDLAQTVASRAAAAPAAGPGGPAPGARTAILRMAQRGEEPERIAAAVGLARHEVDLVVKVHRAVSGVGR